MSCFSTSSNLQLCFEIIFNYISDYSISRCSNWIHFQLESWCLPREKLQKFHFIGVQKQLGSVRNSKNISKCSRTIKRQQMYDEPNREWQKARISRCAVWRLCEERKYQPGCLTIGYPNNEREYQPGCLSIGYPNNEREYQPACLSIGYPNNEREYQPGCLTIGYPNNEREYQPGCLTIGYPNNEREYQPGCLTIGYPNREENFSPDILQSDIQTKKENIILDVSQSDIQTKKENGTPDVSQSDIQTNFSKRLGDDKEFLLNQACCRAKILSDTLVKAALLAGCKSNVTAMVIVLQNELWTMDRSWNVDFLIRTD